MPANNEPVTRMNFSAPTSEPASTEHVWRRVKAAATQMCQDRRAGLAGQGCSFHLNIEPSSTAGPNAKSWMDASGRSHVSINAALLAQLRNIDEVAFVLAHEAAHTVGAHHVVGTQMNLGSGVPLGRKMDKSRELEADAIGTMLMMKAGFDPLSGSEILRRLYRNRPEPTRSHPGLAQRVALVKTVHQVIKSGGTINID